MMSNGTSVREYLPLPIILCRPKNPELAGPVYHDK
jgi:hypothetical protein